MTVAEDRRLRVFLSYAREDYRRVRNLHTFLKDEAAEPWLDRHQLIAGEHWREEIADAIESADIVLLCISSRAVRKEGFVQKEFRIALNRAETKPRDILYAVPVLFDDLELPRELRHLHCIKWFRSDARDRLSRALQHRAQQLGIRVADSPRGFFLIEADEFGRIPLPRAVAAYLGGPRCPVLVFPSGAATRNSIFQIHPLGKWKRISRTKRFRDEFPTEAVHSAAHASEIDDHDRIALTRAMQQWINLDADVQFFARCFRGRVDVISRTEYDKRLQKAMESVNSKLTALHRKGL